MIPASAFTALIAEMERKPIDLNSYRKKTGLGRSQAFGVVNRRSIPPDYSRNNWRRPYLYSLLLDFAATYVDISFNAITVNQNYQAGKHYDNHNGGKSFLVAFGSYSGGELLIHEGDCSGAHDVCGKPMTADFSQILHSVAPFTGTRYSLVFYNYVWPGLASLPPSSVRVENGEHWFYRGEDKITRGLAHPLMNRTRAEIVATAKAKKSMGQ